MRASRKHFYDNTLNKLIPLAVLWKPLQKPLKAHRVSLCLSHNLCLVHYASIQANPRLWVEQSTIIFFFAALGILWQI